MASTEVSWVQIPLHRSKPKLQGAFPLQFGKIFTDHLLSKPSCKCTTPFHSCLTMWHIILEILKNVNRQNNFLRQLTPQLIPVFLQKPDRTCEYVLPEYLLPQAGPHTAFLQSASRQTQELPQDSFPDAY